MKGNTTNHPCNYAHREQIIQIVQTNPSSTLQSIADVLGVSRERVRQICMELNEAGIIEDRRALRRKALEDTANQAIQERKHRKQIWRRMMFIGLRQRIRHMAHIDHHGLTYGNHMPDEQVICQFSGCTRSAYVRGFCLGHYGLLRKTGSLWVRRNSRHRCKEEGCFYFVYARGLCQAHYESFRRHTPRSGNTPAHNKSGYRGVSWSKTERRWVANIRRPRDRQEHLGAYDSKEMAARAYDTAARKYLGDTAKLNFPDENIEVVKEPPRLRVGISGYRGIEWHRTKERWIVRIWQDGKQVYIGQFPDLEHAARVQDGATRYYLGDTAPLNFPDSSVLFFDPTQRPHAKQKLASSHYRGVEKQGNRWRARIEAEKQRIGLGFFLDEESAARAYDVAARKYFGSRAVLNFPDISEVPDGRTDRR